MCEIRKIKNDEKYIICDFLTNLIQKLESNYKLIQS